jgi:tRNA(Phe) wybutosine-synthesizing methylase Tyw3
MKDVMKDSQDERKVNRKLIPMLFRGNSQNNVTSSCTGVNKPILEGETG